MTMKAVAVTAIPSTTLSTLAAAMMPTITTSPSSLLVRGLRAASVAQLLRDVVHLQPAPLALAPSAVVAMVWRWSCRRTMRRHAPRMATTRLLYATWYMRSALTCSMPPGRCAAPPVCATLVGASVVRSLP
jgi:hypothetical protein